jgi:hypothetical protein
MWTSVLEGHITNICRDEKQTVSPLAGHFHTHHEGKEE